jgi:hypothetical protein
MFIEEKPSGLVDELGVWVAVFLGRIKNGAVFNVQDFFPWNEFVRFSSAVRDDDADSIGERVNKTEDKIGNLPHAVFTIPDAERALEELGKIIKRMDVM